MLTVAFGVATAGLVIAQASLLAYMITAAFLGGADLREMRGQLVALAGVLAARALVAWASEWAAYRASAAAKSQLRAQLVEHAVRLGPARAAEGGAATGELVVLATHGLDALDGYFARYLPQLVLAALVPLAVGVRILASDLTSALIIAVTVPLIPLFMIIIGKATQRKMDRQWQTLARLGHHFLDVVAGLGTLKVFGRAKAQIAMIRSVTDDLRRRTMSTLRLAFVSSLALELLTTLSVALVAVSIGLRLVDGSLGLQTGLLVLLLAPEVYLPLRQVGTQFHASAEGVAAAQQAFDVLALPLPEVGPPAAGCPRSGCLGTGATAPADVPVPDLSTATIRVQGLSMSYPGRSVPALEDLDLELRPGRIVALVGPSGAGKSTVVAALLGFAGPSAGRILVGDADRGGPVDLADLDLDAWRAQLAWVPQRPHLFAATVADNIRLAHASATDADVMRAAELAGAAEFIEELPAGLGTLLGERGAGLSTGQRRRIALARAFLRDAPVLLLDEPTAGLDADSEAVVADAIGALMAGRTVLLVTHRPALAAIAHQVVELAAPLATAAGQVAVSGARLAAPVPEGMS